MTISFRHNTGFGKCIEYYIVDLMLKQGLDVYLPVVSDLATSPLHAKQTKIQKSFLGHSLTIGYQNGLALNNLDFPVGTQRFNLASISTWNKDTIQARTDTLVAMLLDINRLPHD